MKKLKRMPTIYIASMLKVVNYRLVAVESQLRSYDSRRKIDRIVPQNGPHQPWRIELFLQLPPIQAPSQSNVYEKRDELERCRGYPYVWIVCDPVKGIHNVDFVELRVPFEAKSNDRHDHKCCNRDDINRYEYEDEALWFSGRCVRPKWSRTMSKKGQPDIRGTQTTDQKQRKL